MLGKGLARAEEVIRNPHEPGAGGPRCLLPRVTLDVLPDVFPGGLADDAAVVGFIIEKVRSEIVKFEAWERGGR